MSQHSTPKTPNTPSANPSLKSALRKYTINALKFDQVEQPHKRACSWCNKESATAKCCSVCKMDYYCSRECQTAHWQDHKHICYKGLTVDTALFMNHVTQLVYHTCAESVGNGQRLPWKARCSRVEKEFKEQHFVANKFVEKHSILIITNVDMLADGKSACQCFALPRMPSDTNTKMFKVVRFDKERQICWQGSVMDTDSMGLKFQITHMAFRSYPIFDQLIKDIDTMWQAQEKKWKKRKGEWLFVELGFAYLTESMMRWFYVRDSIKTMHVNTVMPKTAVGQVQRFDTLGLGGQSLPTATSKPNSESNYVEELIRKLDYLEQHCTEEQKMAALQHVMAHFVQEFKV